LSTDFNANKTENMNIEAKLQEIERAAALAEQSMQEFARSYAPMAEKNFAKVLDAMRAARISETHLKDSTGYGYGDVGRDSLEEVYAEIFGAECCLLRQQIVSGTHAISLALLGNLLPGDELLYVGTPYDTLQKIIGLQGETPGSLLESGALYREVDFDFLNPSAEAIIKAIQPQTKILAFQRSRGYSWRQALSLEVMGQLITEVKQVYPKLIVFVDNCYGEFVCEQEPLQLGADMIAGSLIKNPGGGIAPCGGYIAGRRDLVERAAARLTAPGIGAEVGCSLLAQRVFYQGLFMAPLIVQEALCGAEFTAAFFRNLGFDVSPEPLNNRSDIVEAIKFGKSELLLAFIRGVQKYSPVDSYVRPDPWDMPGYTDQVIMASGAFVSGSSIELSADAPVREPYIAYFQGGLNRYHAKLAVVRSVQDMAKDGLL
jgi:cystathionine beta-lyase family protein involved in aluminum resistance